MPQKEEKSHEKHQISGERAGRVLYGGDHSISELAQIISGDVDIKSTEITSAFTVDDYCSSYPDRVPLFVTSASGRLRFPTDKDKILASEGSVITALVPAEPARGKDDDDQ